LLLLPSIIIPKLQNEKLKKRKNKATIWQGLEMVFDQKLK